MDKRIGAILKLRAAQVNKEVADTAAAAKDAKRQKERAEKVRAALPDKLEELRSVAEWLTQQLTAGAIALRVTDSPGRDDVLSDVQVALSLNADQTDPFAVTTPFPLHIRIAVDGTAHFTGPGLDGREKPRRQRDFQIEALDTGTLQDVLIAFVEAAVAARGDPSKAAKEEKQKRLVELERRASEAR